MDVSTSVQLERLDELERQIALIDAPPGLEATSPRSIDDSVSAVMHADNEHTPPEGSGRSLPSMALNPRLQTADTQSDTAQDSNNDGTRETESTYSSH
jgi:hypothetical protein